MNCERCNAEVNMRFNGRCGRCYIPPVAPVVEHVELVLEDTNEQEEVYESESNREDSLGDGSDVHGWLEGDDDVEARR